MKTRINISILVLNLFALTACSEQDFLDLPPYGLVAGETFLDNPENATAAVNAVYATTLSTYTYGRFFWGVADVMSDDSEAGGEVGGLDQPNIQLMARFQHDPNNADIFEFWSGLYQGNYRADYVIENIPNAPFADERLKKQLEGEARFLKALFNFDLVRVFGPVPYVPNLLPFDEYAQLERAPVAVILHGIQEQLIKAYDLLPGRYNSTFENRYPNKMELGRATKDAAKTLLLKAYVYESSYHDLNRTGKDPNDFYAGCQNKWDQARELADDLISNQAQYGIGLDPDFERLWRVAGEDSDEIIFKFNATSSGRQGELIPGTGGYWGTNNMGVTYNTFRAFYYHEDEETESDASGRSWGWGFNCPRQEIVELFDSEDPRKRLTIRFDGDIVKRNREVDAANENQIWATAMPSLTSPTGYQHRKYERNPDEYGANQSAHMGPLAWKVLRFSDVLLLGAEAHLQPGGNTATALEYVNRVRQRARNISTPAAAEPAHLTSIDMVQLRIDRRLELAFEQNRFFDLVRWGIAHEVLNGMVLSNGAHTTVFEHGKHEHLPVPTRAITESGGKVNNFGIW